MTYTTQEVMQVIDRTLRVPDSCRRFTASAALARQLYHIDEDLLTVLARGGLRVRGSGSGTRYDELDLANVAISLRQPSPVYLAMRWWPATLQLHGGKPSSYVVGFRSRCAGRNCRLCRKTFAPELTSSPARFSQTPDDQFADARAAVTVALEPVPLPSRITDLFAELDGVEWHLLPPELARDVDFIRSARIADCRLSSYYLCHLALAREIPARTSFGIIVSVPFSAFHYWTEFFVGDRWLPADPLLIRSLERWNLLSPGQWPESMSPSGVLWRLSNRNLALAWHDGRPAQVTMPTQKAAPDN